MVDDNSLDARRARAEAAARETLATSGRLLAKRGAGAPRRGDLYALSAGAEAGIEWLVASDPEGDHVTVAAADGMPLVGALDHRIEASATTGPLVLRGAAVTSIRIDLLPADRRVGVVSTSQIDRFWRRLEAADAAGATAEEISADPEYRAWSEQRLEPALGALVELDGAHTSRAAARSPAALPRRVAERTGPSWWLMAASVTLAVLATWVVSERAGAPAPAPAGGEVAMVFFAPQADVTRSAEATVVDWAPDLSSVVLAFRTLTPEAYATHRIELIDRDAEETAPPLWSRSGLRLQGTSEVVVLVPVDVLVGKNVEARLFGLGGTGGVGTERSLERWRFRMAER